MFGKTTVRGSLVAAFAVYAIFGVVPFAVLNAAARRHFVNHNNSGVGSVTIPTGYGWTDVTVQCWGGGGGGSGYYGFGGGGGGGRGAAIILPIRTQRRCSQGYTAI